MNWSFAPEPCKISHEHLTRTFVNATGMPPPQAIIQLRLERASHLLRHSTLSIRKIAEQCGFAENHYFSRVFASNFGTTATAYRSQYADPRIQHIEPSGLFEVEYPMNAYVHF
jgi:AraC family transcriptional regulator